MPIWMLRIFMFHAAVEVLVGITLMFAPGIMNRLFAPDFIAGTMGIAFVQMYGLMAFGFGVYCYLASQWLDIKDHIRCAIQCTIFHFFITAQMTVSPLLKGAVAYHAAMGVAFLVISFHSYRAFVRILVEKEAQEQDKEN